MAHGKKTPQALALQVWALRRRNLSYLEIKRKTGLSTSTIQSILNRMPKEGENKQAHFPPATLDRDPSLEHLFEHTVEAFEAFFNKYSPYTLAPHSRQFVSDAMGKDNVLLNVPPRHAKRLADSTPVFTPEGWKTHGELRVGDYVFAPDGSPTEVVGIGGERRENMRVRLTDDEIIADPFHEWVVWDRVAHGWRIKETQELAATLHEKGGRNRYLIPYTAPLIFPDADLPLDPYVFGCWLGDGKSGGPSICGSWDDLNGILKQFELRGWEPSWQTTHKTTGVGYVGFRGMHTLLKGLGVINNKRIPTSYLTASEEQRRDLLRGLVDTDGSVEPTTGRVRFVNTNLILIEDVETLVRSLGYRASRGMQPPSGKGKLDVYTVQWTPHDGQEQGYLERKTISTRAVRRMRAVVNVSPADDEPGRCIQVAHPDGQYLAGRSMVPTHNSEVFSVWVPIWLICMNRDVRIIIVSKTHQLALKWLRTLARHLEENENLIIDFNFFKPQGGERPWRPNMGSIEVAGRQRLLLSGEPTVQVFGAMQQVIGVGADVIIGDDPVDLANVRTQAQRDNEEEWWDSEVDSRFDPSVDVPFSKIVIGTRAHEDDLYGRLSRRKVGTGDTTNIWTHINHPAIRHVEGYADIGFDSDHLALWPERIPLTVAEANQMALKDKRRVNSLERIRRGMAEPIFERTYQQNPAPMSERIFRREWIFGVKDDLGFYRGGCVDRDRELGQPAQPEEGRARCISTDPSGSMFWGMSVGDVLTKSPDFDVKLLEIWRRKMPIRTFHAEMERIGETYQPDFWISEINSVQRHFVDDEWAEDYRKRYNIKLIKHETQRNKSDEEMGVEAMALDFEYGRIRIPFAGDHTRRSVTDFIDEIIGYGVTANTWDTVMSLWFMKNNHRKLYLSGGGKLQWGFRLPDRLRSR